MSLVEGPTGPSNIPHKKAVLLGKSELAYAIIKGDVHLELALGGERRIAIFEDPQGDFSRQLYETMAEFEQSPLYHIPYGPDLDQVKKADLNKKSGQVNWLGFKLSLKQDFLSLFKSTPPPPSPDGKVIIHCLRHAESVHNIMHSKPVNQRWSSTDPLLTCFGGRQAEYLRNTFIPMNKITHIFCSPMKRTLGTCILGFKPLLDSGLGVIAYPDLKEWGTGSSSTGSPVKDLQKILSAFPIDLSLLHLYESWETYFDADKLHRPERVRKSLWEFGQLALRAQAGQNVVGPWSQYVFTPKKNEDNNIEILVRKVKEQPVLFEDISPIVVISHECFLETLVEGTGRKERFRNAMYKSYEFPTEDKIKEGLSPWKLIETEESRIRTGGHY